mmetsp:Transcript_9878/g.39987  ORF Transcript_9878/g.39987 Transcript_9878/m.39987 type:complete len:213 (-) Transcript_9878:673-1311(-)
MHSRLHGGGGIGLRRGGALVRVELRVELLRRHRGLLRLLGAGLTLTLALPRGALGSSRVGLGAALLGAGPGHHLGHHLASAAAAGGVEGDCAPAPRWGDGDSRGEGDAAAITAAHELNLQRAAVELDAVVGLDGLDGVAPFREDDLGGALGSAVLVEVEAGLLHPTDLREQLLRVASGEWRLGEGVFGQGSIRCSLERVSASVRRRKPRTTI